MDNSVFKRNSLFLFVVITMLTAGFLIIAISVKYNNDREKWESKNASTEISIYISDSTDSENYSYASTNDSCSYMYFALGRCVIKQTDDYIDNTINQETAFNIISYLLQSFIELNPETQSDVNVCYATFDICECLVNLGDIEYTGDDNIDTLIQPNWTQTHWHHIRYIYGFQRERIKRSNKNT